MAELKAVPMSPRAGWTAARGVPDPRGLPIKAVDGVIAGTIVEAWAGQSARRSHCYTVQLSGSSIRVLLPQEYVEWPYDGPWGKDHVIVKALTAAQFRDLPASSRQDRIAEVEVSRSTAYMGDDLPYAVADRSESRA